MEEFRAPVDESEARCAVLSCDYNGWADMPEEERESVDVYLETTHLALFPRAASLVSYPKSPIAMPGGKLDQGAAV